MRFKMSAVLPDSTMTKPRDRGEKKLPAWTREPLLHFAVLGALLFGIDHVVSSRIENPNVIVMGAAVDKEARQVFAASRGHQPNDKELAALRAVWLENEVLYRHGLSMQLDRGDPSIRERVIFKALSVIDAGTKLPAYTDDSLRKWFEAHRDKYDDPARVDFQEAVLSGDHSETSVRAFVAQLNGGAQGDAQAGLRVFKNRPHANLVESYGEEFAKSIEASPAGEWRAQPSKDGWRAIRIDAMTPPRPGNFEALRGVVLQDWTDTTLSEQRSAAVRALTKQYTLKISGESK
jgi:hypothetical protein